MPVACDAVCTRPVPAPLWKPPRVEVVLIAGYLPLGHKCVWVLNDRHDEPTASLLNARRFAFNDAGYRAALAAGNALCAAYAPTAVAFTARVVIYGEGTAPEEVIEVWRLEGSEPVDLGRYSFQ